MKTRILTEPEYYLTDDNFPIKVLPYDPKIHPSYARDEYFQYENDITVTRHWKGEEYWSMTRDSAKTIKEEFDLWVEYWKIYWEIEAVKEEGGILLDKKKSEIEEIKRSIVELKKQ